MKKYMHIYPTMIHHLSDKERKNVYMAILVDVGTVHILCNVIGKQ